MRSICLTVVAAVLLCGVFGSGEFALGDTYLQGVGNDHSREFKHDRFYTGADKAFHAAAYDFSGVGRSSDGRWATMISPRYFVSARHSHPSTNGSTTVTFYEGNTKSSGGHTYTVDSWSFRTSYGGDGSDLWLGRLTGDIPAAADIAYYPVLDLDSDSDYVDRLIYTYGRPDRVGLNNIDQVHTRSVGSSKGRVIDFDFDAVGGAGESESYLMSGDSGGPTFTVWDGALALLGIHWYNTGTAPPDPGDYSGDSFVPYYISQLNDNMDFGQSVTTVPEPASIILLTLGAMGLLRRRRG